MFTPRNLLVAGIAGCALVIATAGPPAYELLGAQPALAKNGHGGGNGNGNGNGQGGSGNLPSGPGKSAGAPGHQKSSSVASAKAARDAQKLEAQSLNAKVAGLHAAHANLHAFIHASPNSKVGRIAAYATAEVDVEKAQATRDLAQDTLDTADSILAAATDAYNDAVAVLTDQYGYIDTSVVALQGSKDGLLLTDTSSFSDDELAAYNAEIAAIDQARATAAALEDAQTAYDDASRMLTDAEQALTDAEDAAVDALNAAANANRVPVDDDVTAWVDAQLEEGGILDYYRMQAAEEDVAAE